MKKKHLFVALVICAVVATSLGVATKVVEDKGTQVQQIESVVKVTYNNEEMDLQGQKPY